MKITDMVLSAILKRGILYEARNCDMEFEVPMAQEGDSGEGREKKVTIKLKAEHITIRVEKE